MFTAKNILSIVELGQRLELNVKIIERKGSNDYEHQICYKSYRITEDDVYYVYTNDIKLCCPIERIIQVILE